MRKLLLLALLPCVSYAGTFKKVSEGTYEFTGIMVPSDVVAYKELILKEPRLTVIVDSEGGYLSAGVGMAEATLLFHDKIEIVARECYSAAALWAMSDPGFRYESDKSLVAWHLAWQSLGGTPVEQTVGDTSEMAMDLFLAMYRTQGASSVTLFRLMCEARDWGGINTFVVLRKDGTKRTGLWSPEGWKWMDGTASASTRLMPVPTFIKP